MRIKARLFVGGDKNRQFEATLQTANISVGGIFFQSTFFLKMGQFVDVELRLPPHDRLVRARGTVVRIETLEASGKSLTGFAVRFDEYFESSEVVLANYFLAPVLREFLQGYVRKQKLRATADEIDRFVDVLAAWELSKTKESATIWSQER